jgi:hypothetical protein
MSTAPTIYIHADLLAGGESLVWQFASWPDGPSVRIAFQDSCSEKAQRRRTFKNVTHAIACVAERDPEQVNCLAIGKRTWKIDASLLRAAFPPLRDVKWLGTGLIEVEPEFDDKEAETFGWPSYSGSVCLYITPETIVPALTGDERLRVLVLHGPDNAPKHELLAWLRGADILADARTVGEMTPNAEGSVNERVTRGITWAEKLIAIVSPDERSPSGAPNVIDEIGRCIGAQHLADLAIVRHRACTDLWSNLAGVVRIEYEQRIKETFLGLAKFLGALRPGRPLEK